MSDRAFEAQLERLFAQPPAVNDPSGFASRVESRLERGERFRSVLIGAAGVAGGVFAASQTFGSGLIARLGEVRLPKRAGLEALEAGRYLSSEDLAALSGGGEVVWMAAAMLALTVGFLATRFADAF